MRTRRAKATDAKRIVKIWLQGAGQAIARVPTDLSERKLTRFFRREMRLARPPFGMWVAELNGEVCAFCAVLPYDNNPATRPYNGEAMLYVARRYRRRGLGQLLTRHLMAAASGLHYVIGFVAESNVASIRLLKKCGWTRVGMLPQRAKEPGAGRGMVVAFVPAEK